MACEETDASCHYVHQIPQPFVWTEDAHGLYLSFLEDSFVNDLYQCHYCSVDICGYSPPSTANTPASSIAAECPSPPSPAMAQPSQSKSIAEPKAYRKRFRSGSKAGSTKRKGKWLTLDVGLDNQHIFETCIGPDKNMSYLEQPGNSSQPFEISECVVPKGPRGGLKKSRGKGIDVKFCGTERQATDQVEVLLFPFSLGARMMRGYSNTFIV